MHLLAAESEDILKHRTFERRKLIPLSRLLQTFENVVFLLEHQELGLLHLCDLQVAAHREIHENSRDVAGIHRVVNKRTDFGGRHIFGRVVHRGHCHARIRIFAPAPPDGKHHSEREHGQKDDGISDEEPPSFGQS